MAARGQAGGRWHFIRKKQSGERTYYYLVENQRVGGKVKQKVVKYLGDGNDAYYHDGELKVVGDINIVLARYRCQFDRDSITAVGYRRRAAGEAFNGNDLIRRMYVGGHGEADAEREWRQTQVERADDADKSARQDEDMIAALEKLRKQMKVRAKKAPCNCRNCTRDRRRQESRKKRERFERFMRSIR